jgi:hypothetical protein
VAVTETRDEGRTWGEGGTSGESGNAGPWKPVRRPGCDHGRMGPVCDRNLSPKSAYRAHLLLRLHGVG